MPLSIQVKLLRVLETKQFERVGDHRPVSVDVRIIAATNRNLARLVAEKKFREDLFFRRVTVWNRMRKYGIDLRRVVREQG